MSDASAHLAGKKIFAKMDCSQAYFSMQMADEKSVQLLAFNFGGRTFAFKRLAQGLNRSPTAFSSCVSKHLEACVANDQCFVYFDDLGSGTYDGIKLLENLDEIFKSIVRSGFKLSMEKCQFGISQIQFLGHTITENGLSPNKDKVEKFLNNIKTPKTIKQVRKFIGFIQSFQKFIPNLAVKLRPFFNLLRKNEKFIITKEHTNSIEILKRDLNQACQLSLKMAKPNCVFILVCDASFYAAGYILLIEDYHDHSNQPTEKSYAPVAFGSHLFSPNQLKHSIYVKEFLSVYLAFETFEHYLWGVSNKPIIVLTDNKSVTKFFQAKVVPGNLWNAVVYILSFNFVIGHIPGKANATADYLSRFNLNPAIKMKLKLENQIPVKKINFSFQKNRPKNQICHLAPIEDNQTTKDNFQIPTIVIENEESEFETMIDEFTSIESLINSLDTTNPLDEMNLESKLTPLNIEREQMKDLDIQKAIVWIKKKIRPNTTYSSYDYQKYQATESINC